jgi:hypothetical protein
MRFFRKLFTRDNAGTTLPDAPVDNTASTGFDEKLCAALPNASVTPADTIPAGTTLPDTPPAYVNNIASTGFDEKPRAALPNASVTPADTKPAGTTLAGTTPAGMNPADIQESLTSSPAT